LHGPRGRGRLRRLGGVQVRRSRGTGTCHRARHDALAGSRRGPGRPAGARRADAGARHGGDSRGRATRGPGMVTVGVLALQGDFAAHGRALRRLGVATLAVRKAADLDAIDALVLPGGESTAMLHGLARDGLEAPLRSVLVSGRPVLGTCAGAILLASRVTNPPQRSFAALALRGG